ncbi:tRNA preQ1(34) S-adenosylmethionine ribosyltransferase-isomerase QueA [Candidatus Peregrinibacteria bacterium CG08_land_8_20_14_0_20_41_10]|nr:MAG: tRNA preQ1(34) S-adenosylmethionine ribosyltransferase-isomerase QueA [Candidatus Peregrinibacteria bacterium CG08_land_8_20_14_0_20_41_10]
MLLSDFDYHLPPELIAQNPLSPRDHCRLMLLKRPTESIEHKYFYNLVNLLTARDVLVLNESKVIKARLFGKLNSSTTEKSSEVFLLKQLSPFVWECLARPGHKFKTGTEIDFYNSDNQHPSSLKGKVAQVLTRGMREISFNLTGKAFEQELQKIGQIPLPPYIKNFQGQNEDYQTVYATKKGSVAAPTAGMHFTEELLNKLKNKGVQIEKVILHIGLDTFQPLQVEQIETHQMHAEDFELEEQTAERLNLAKQAGKRIIAVGTTTVRVLETCAIEAKGKGQRAYGKGQIVKGGGEKQKNVPLAPNHLLSAQTGSTSLFIYPSYQFKFVDALLTNFHLPKSSLLLMVSTFAGREFILRAYQEAIQQKYRFYSFGDAMLIE